VLDRRISVLASGRLRPPLFPQPVVSSAGTAWTGFLLEQHRVPTVEFPPSMSFPGHLVGVSICEKPVVLYWREDGRNRRAEVSSGHMALRSSQDLIACRQEGPCTLLSLLIDESTMERACEEAPGYRRVELIPQPDVHDSTLNRYVRMLFGDLMSGCPAGRLFGESIVNAIAAHVAQKYAVINYQFPHPVRLSSHCLRRVLEFIHSHLDEDLGIAEIAQIALISPYHFGRLFKKSTGQSVHQYVLGQRIREAKGLLTNRHLTLVEIGAAVGMASQSHFTTVFKNKVGVTPGLYRSYLLGRAPAHPEIVGAADSDAAA
jgi:AraC family transcriptional regulator